MHKFCRRCNKCNEQPVHRSVHNIISVVVDIGVGLLKGQSVFFSMTEYSWDRMTSAVTARIWTVRSRVRSRALLLRNSINNNVIIIGGGYWIRLFDEP